MRSPLPLIVTVNVLGIVLMVLLWHIMDAGITIDHTGLHLINGTDFLNYWGAPQIASNDPHILFTGRGYERALHQLFDGDFAQLRWSYPLHSLFFYAPFSALPYVPALAIWLVLGLFLYAATSYATFPAASKARLLALLLVAPVTLLALITRQNGLFIGAASIGVLLLLDRKQPVLAGVLLGCLTIKPQLFILWPLMLLVTREWRCILAAGLTTITLLALSVAVYGVDAWADYLTFMRDKQWQLLSASEFDERRKLYHLMMPGLIPALRIVHAPDMLVTTLQVALSASVAITTFFAFRRPLTFTQRTLILATASLLISPYSFNYDMTLLTTALILLWSERTNLDPYAKMITGIAYLLPFLVYILNVCDVPLAPLFLLLLFLWSLRDAGVSARTILQSHRKINH